VQWSSGAASFKRTDDGEALVARNNVPMRKSKEPERYDHAAAEELGYQTYEKASAAWGIQNAAAV
jgi:hypothetical protein